jgi:DNA-binding MarR family transcriptional regulator
VAKLIPSQFQLDKDEMLVLQALSRGGALQPSQLAAETLLLPADLNKVLTSLADMRLIIVRPDETPDGQVVILTGEGRELVYQNISKKNAA